jgi:hypothetical protein
MKLEMKAIKHAKFASKEMYCYEGVVYIDGKKSIYVSNEGFGGSDRQDTVGEKMDYSLIKKVDEWCKKNLPKWKVSFDGADAEEHDTSFEMWCHEQVTQFLRRKELKRFLKKEINFVEDGELRYCTYQGVKQISGVHLNHFKIKNKDRSIEVILNDLPFEDAFKIYNEHCDKGR